MTPETPEKRYVMNEKMIDNIIAYMAQADHQKFNNRRTLFLNFAVIIFMAVFVNYFLADKPPEQLWALALFVGLGIVFVVAYFIVGRKRKYDFFLDKWKKHFHDLMYDASVRSEIDNMISDVQ